MTGYARCGTGYGFATVKYDPRGIQQWAHCCDSIPWGDDIPVAVAVDRWGSASVTSTSAENDSEMNDYATLKFTEPSGDLDGDGDSDLDDFLIAAFCFDSLRAGPDLPSPQCITILDFDADEDQDLRDFAAFQALFGR